MPSLVCDNQPQIKVVNESSHRLVNDSTTAVTNMFASKSAEAEVFPLTDTAVPTIIPQHWRAYLVGDLQHVTTCHRLTLHSSFKYFIQFLNIFMNSTTPSISTSVAKSANSSYDRQKTCHLPGNLPGRLGSLPVRLL